MSTRSVTHFAWNPPGVEYSTPRHITVYKHTDGYPNGQHGMAATFKDFFETLKRETEDTRVSDPYYLASKFVVYLARGYGHPPGSLDFLSVGIVPQDWDDWAYEYWVDCNEILNGVPFIYYRGDINIWRDLHSDLIHRR